MASVDPRKRERKTKWRINGSAHRFVVCIILDTTDQQLKKSNERMTTIKENKMDLSNQ
jgi:hypothetical protein